MGILPMFAVHRDFDLYSDRINKSAAIFSWDEWKIAALLLIGWNTSQNCGLPQSMARMAMPHHSGGFDFVVEYAGAIDFFDSDADGRAFGGRGVVEAVSL